MKITNIEVIPIQLPLRMPIRDCHGTFSFSNHGIVVVHDDSGECGIGEIVLAWFGGAHSLCREVEEFWVSHLIGEEASDINRLTKKLDKLVSFSKRHLLPRAAIEMALWDLLGKHLGVPIYQLLGGALRDQIPVTGGVIIDSPDRMVDAAIRRVEEGFRDLKLKVGENAKNDIEVIRRIRDALPDEISLRVDANMAWKTAKEAKKIIDEMVKSGVQIVEQPLAANCYEELRWLRENTTALILLDESVWSLEDAKTCLDTRAGDLLHVYVCEAGGIGYARRIFELASQYHVECTIGSMPEGKIGASAGLHLGFAMDNLSAHASDIRGFLGYSEDVVIEDVVIENGFLLRPEKPGLGVTVDLEQLRKLEVSTFHSLPNGHGLD